MTSTTVTSRDPFPDRTAAEGRRQLVYVWQLPVRLTHWLIFFSIAFLVFTGIYIGRPFFTVSGPAGQHFAMGTMKAIHSYAAIVFTLSVLARIVWMFLGNRWASWREFLPLSRRRWRGFAGTLKFYLFAWVKPPYVTGHNAVAGLTYAVVFLLYFAIIASGLGLYAISAPVDSPLRVFSFLLSLFGGPQSARWVHHVVMWLLLGFVAHHVASAVLMARVERTGTIDSIFSGYKFVPPEELEEPARLERRRS
jgi:Ni/Fe-hydrogenase 1 B-type cytochrome subunit